MPVFLDDNDRLALLREIEAQVRLGVLIVHAFCLMLNHIHILCETPCAGMGRIMHDILGNYASAFNRLHDRVGHLWQGRYKAILVQDGIYLLNCSKYIHLNPHNAGIDTTDFSYPWSSFGTYMGQSTLVPWVCTDRILGNFTSPDQYRSFLERQMEESANPFELATAGIAYGDAGFVRQVCQRVQQTGSQDDRPVIRLLQRAGTVPSIDAVRSAVESAFPDASRCQTRRYLVWALHTCTWLKGCEIGHAVGLKRSAISEILRGVELRRLADKQTATGLAAVEEQLQYISSDVVSPTRQIGQV